MFSLNIVRDDLQPDNRLAEPYGRLVGFLAVPVAIFGLDTLVLDNALWAGLRESWAGAAPLLERWLHVVWAALTPHR